MKNNNRNEWRKRRIRYVVNNSVIGRLIMRLYKYFESLIWLFVSLGILVVILKMFSSSF